jgi:Raf kinase inhibitor-like YbhB/YbcL family protein
MTVTGPWANGSEIDARYTCEGEGLSPSLAWTPGPEDTQAYALTIVDMDNENAIPWVVTNIDFSATTSPEGAVPAGGVVARNPAGVAAYDPPCPPLGSTHTYIVSVYALDSLTPLADNPDAGTIIADIEAAAIQAATTVFTVTR